MEVNAEDNDGLLVNLVRGASAAVGFQLSSDDVGVFDNAGVCKDKLRQVEHRRAISENVVLEGDMFKVVLHDDDSDFDLNASGDIIFLDEEEGHDSVSLLNEEIINVSDLSLMKTTTEQDANGKETKRKLINIGLEENNEPSAIRNEKRPWDFSNKFLDRSFTALSPSNKKNNLLELEFLKNAERTELSPSAVDADALLTSSNFPSVRIGTSSQNEWRKYNLSSHSDDHLKLDDTVSSFASESRIRLENNRNIKTGCFEKILLETLARNSNLGFDEQLKDDAKLWCQTYVKLIDCANLLCLATPSSLYVPRSRKQLLDCSTMKGLSSNNGFKNEATILALSANVGISKRCSKEKGNMFDNSGSQTKTRRRKGRCRSKKTAKAKKPPASQSKLCCPYRRMIIIGSKEGAKAALAGEQDEVICKFDAWRKLHKSKEKKKSSWNPESDKTLSGLTVKQEPIIDFDSLVFRNGCPPVETKASESLSTNIKSEFDFGMDALNTLAHGGNSNSCQTVITIEPKKDVTNTDFVFIKQEPANDFCYADSSDNATVDQKIPVTMELVCNKLPIGSQPMASETCFDQIYEEKQWLPAVTLKQIPPWILQNLQSSGNEISFGDKQFTDQSLNPLQSMEDRNDSMFIKGYSLKDDHIGLMPLENSGGCTKDELVLRKAILPSKGHIQPRTQQTQPSPSKTPDRERGVGVNCKNEMKAINTMDSHQEIEALVDTLQKSGRTYQGRGRGRGHGRGRGRGRGRVQLIDPSSDGRCKTKKCSDITMPGVVISENLGIVEEVEKRTEQNINQREVICKNEIKVINTMDSHQEIEALVDTLQKSGRACRGHGRGRGRGRGRVQLIDPSSVGRCETKKSSDIMVPDAVISENLGLVEEVEKRTEQNVNQIKSSRRQLAKHSRKVETESSDEKPLKDDTESKMLKTSKGPCKKLGKLSKVRLVDKKQPHTTEELVASSELGFVIPKKKPKTLNAPCNRQICQQNIVPKTKSVVNSLRRIPQISKTLSDEDKQRSVFAKLDKISEKKTDSSWDSKDIRPAKVPEKLLHDFNDHRGPIAQDTSWQRMETSNRFRNQRLNQAENYRFPPVSQQIQRNAPVGIVQPFNDIRHYRGQSFVSGNTGTSSQLELHNRQAFTTAPSKPGPMSHEQPSFPTVGSHIPVIHSTHWATANQTNCFVVAGKQTAEMEIKERLNPVLREVPCVDFSISCNDLGVPDGNCVWPRSDSPASSTSVPSQPVPFSERPANCDNGDIDDDIRLLVEAVHEAVLQGNVSPEKCNRLRKLYEILCQDLDATDTAEICSRERAGLVRDSLNNEPTLSKSKDSSNPFSKSAATSGFNATLKSQDCFDRRPWVGASCVKRDGRSFQRVDFEQSSLNLNKKEFGLTQSVKNPTFDDLTYRNLELLEDESSWKSLLAQTEDMNISEEHLELVRRLLLEAVKKGICDENLIDVASEACHNIRIESEQLMPKYNSGIGRNPRQNLHKETVEIPFLTKKEQRWENQTFHSVVHCQRDPRQRAERTHTLLLNAQPHFTEPNGVDILKSGINYEKCLPETVSDEVTAAEIVKQESLMSRILDELPLLDTLVAIQIEMCIPNISESSHASETLSIESNQAFGHGSCLLAAESCVSDAEPGYLVGDKMPSDAYDAPSAVSKSSCLNTASAIIGSDMQDNCSSKNSTNKKQFDGNKSIDPKVTEDKVIALSRTALKPHYHNGTITSDEFKFIMKKAIAKICKSRSNDISQKRVTKFINAYVEKVIQSRDK